MTINKDKSSVPGKGYAVFLTVTVYIYIIIYIIIYICIYMDMPVFIFMIHPL